MNGSDKVLDIWDARHKAFHQAIMAGCGSVHRLQVWEHLFDQAERYRHLWLRKTVFSEQALAIKRQKYAELVEAILARDSDRACAMMHKHLMTPEPVIARVLESRGLL